MLGGQHELEVTCSRTNRLQAALYGCNLRFALQELVFDLLGHTFITVVDYRLKLVGLDRMIERLMGLILDWKRELDRGCSRK